MYNRLLLQIVDATKPHEVVRFPGVGTASGSGIGLALTVGSSDGIGTINGLGATVLAGDAASVSGGGTTVLIINA